MNPKNFAAGLGFAFVAAWILFSFGQALLCLLGALVFYALAAVIAGEVDLADVQSRIQAASQSPSNASSGSASSRVR